MAVHVMNQPRAAFSPAPTAFAKSLETMTRSEAEFERTALLAARDAARKECLRYRESAKQQARLISAYDGMLLALCDASIYQEGAKK